MSSSDRVAFDGLCRIYREAIRPEERKPLELLGQMLDRDEYSFIVARQTGNPVGFAILFAAPDEDFALLEYLAVAAASRGRATVASCSRDARSPASSPRARPATRSMPASTC